MKNLDIENHRLHSKINNLEEKIICLEENENQLEQYGQLNNLEISGVPDNIEDE